VAVAVWLWTTTLGVLHLCLGTPLREGQNLVGACTTQIHTNGSWNEAATISHSSCTVGFMDTWRKTTACWFAGSIPYVLLYKGLSLTPFCRYFRFSHVNNTRGVNQSFRPNVNSPDKLAQVGRVTMQTSDNQLAPLWHNELAPRSLPLAYQLAPPKLNIEATQWQW